MRLAPHRQLGLLLFLTASGCAEPKFNSPDADIAAGQADAHVAQPDADTPDADPLPSDATQLPDGAVPGDEAGNDAQLSDGQATIADAQSSQDAQADASVMCGATSCLNGGTCDNGVCRCGAKWTGPSCEHDVDECQAADACKVPFACENLPGGYTCVGQRVDFVLPKRQGGLTSQEYGWQRSPRMNTVLDTLTGLRWHRFVNAEPLDFAAADRWCKDSTLEDYTDWRLPSFAELTTLVQGTAMRGDWVESQEGIVDTPFTQEFVQFGDVWTLSLSPETGRPLATRNDLGDAHDPAVYSATPTAGARCVRREQVRCVVPPSERISSDGQVVRDACTQLTWEAKPRAERLTFADADMYCQQLTLQGRSWRLPRYNELQSMVDVTYAARFPPAFESPYVGAYYHSSTRKAYRMEEAAKQMGLSGSYALLASNGGGIYTDYLHEHLMFLTHVRCVSDGL